MIEALKTKLLIALCTDHGHINQEGSLNCKTCNRRVNIILELLKKEGLL